MSEENVEAAERAIDAVNRRDIEAVLEELDPEVEWHPMIQVLLGGRRRCVEDTRATVSSTVTSSRFSPSFRSSTRRSETLATDSS